MKFTKSILRPVRATRKGGAASLSFLSRRLRTSGSLRGGHQASTFFTKKRGGALENHEPSSPKVTCIGQVRVKSKKRVKHCRRSIGEVSFRVAEQSHGGDGVQRFSSSRGHSHRDQRWVHLPISVCKALRAFRAEICCFFPCRCSCFSRREREKNTERGCYANENGCGAVFTRWLVAVNGGEGRKRREIEVVVGGGGDEQRAEMAMRRSRRHVFEDIDVKDEEEEEEEEEGGEARVSICIPPKNALLLMRCRSDPMKMAALANRFCLDAPKYENGDIEEEENDGDEAVDCEEQEEVGGLFEGKREIFEQNVAVSVEQQLEMEVGDNDCVQQHCEEEEKGEKKIEENDEALVEEVDESAESGERNQRKNEEETEELTEDDEEEEKEEEKKPEESTELEAEKLKNEETAIIKEDIKKENKGGGLPECLLLMMCEPKLSMEVSKETWVRGTDFIRLLPERPRKPARIVVTGGGGGDQEQVKRRPSVDSKSKPRVPAPPGKKNDQQPARSSCFLPPASMAAVIERNQVSAGKCEPFALTRCKSEPMSTAAAKLMPESCFWKNNAGMKLESHRQATLGVGAAGVGF